MGNSAGKIEENEWEFTVRVKKRPLRRQHHHDVEVEQEQEQEAEAEGDDENGTQETVAEFDFSVKANKPSPRKTPLNLTPLNVGGPGMGKKKMRKSPAVAVDGSEETGREMVAPTPRGRKSTCVTMNENGDNPPTLDIRMIKSHLAPLWNLIIPVEFVTKYMIKDNKESKTYEIVNGDKCKTLQFLMTKPGQTYRCVPSKKSWQEFAMEHKLELEDSVRLELISDTQIRVEVSKKKPEVDLDPTPQEEEVEAPAPVPVDLTHATTDAISTEETRQ